MQVFGSAPDGWMRGGGGGGGGERMTGTSVWLFMQPASTTSWFNSFCQLFCILLIMAAMLQQTEGCGEGGGTLFLTVHQQPLQITSKGLGLVFGQCLCSS